MENIGQFKLEIPSCLSSSHDYPNEIPKNALNVLSPYHKQLKPESSKKIMSVDDGKQEESVRLQIKSIPSFLYHWSCFLLFNISINFIVNIEFK